MLASARFTKDVYEPIRRMVDCDNIATIDEIELRRVLEITGNYLACLPGRELLRLLDVWTDHSIEACGGS